MNKLQIKQLSESATLPTRSFPTDSGLDLYASEDTLVTYTHASVIPTGIAVNIPPGYEGQIRPRSGKSSKTNLRVILGTVDYCTKCTVKPIVKEHMCDECYTEHCQWLRELSAPKMDNCCGTIETNNKTALLKE